MQTHKRLKVILTAHEVSPLLGSECSSGWNIITRLGAYHDITVLYAETNQFGTNSYKQQIEEYILKSGIIPGIHFLPISQPKITKKIASLNKFLSHKKTSIGISFLYFLGVRFWEKKILKSVTKLIKEEKIDLVHHFNHLSFREPGYLWKIDKPFLWGPTSGLSLVPYSFLSKLPIKELISNLLRNFLNRFQVSLSGRIQQAIKKSSIIYFVTKDDEAFFSNRQKNIFNILDIGCSSNIKSVDKEPNNGKVKILWIGRFSYLKALDILLEAVSLDVDLRSKLDIYIIGEGPQKEYYKKIADKFQLDNIHWIGQIAKNEVSMYMQESDLLVHSSIKEAASAVILESLSVGLPVICHDAFGMSYAIDETCGIKVPLISPKKSVEGFKEALLTLINKPELIVKLRDGAFRRAKELSWDSMVETIANDYLIIHKNHESTINK